MSVNHIPPSSQYPRAHGAEARRLVRHAFAEDAFQEQAAEVSSARSPQGKAAIPDSNAPDHAGAPAVVVTNDERMFFEKLFPYAAEEVRTHVIYERSGVSRQPQTGLHVDRRG